MNGKTILSVASPLSQRREAIGGTKAHGKALNSLEIALLKAVQENPGKPLLEIYKPFSDRRSDTRLWERLHKLVNKGYLRLKPFGRSKLVFLTPKGKRYISPLICELEQLPEAVEVA